MSSGCRLYSGGWSGQGAGCPSPEGSRNPTGRGPGDPKRGFRTSQKSAKNVNITGFLARFPCGHVEVNTVSGCVEIRVSKDIESESKSMVAQNQKKPMYKEHRLLVCGNPGFPKNRTYHPKFPDRLWYRGTFKSCDYVAVSVVGSRACTELGEKRAFRLSKELAQAGVTVVSGLAKGIDGAAHRGALAGGGRTLAILGTGLNKIYPYEHKPLALAIQNQGAIISQFLSDFSGFRGGRNFMQRNMVVAGLSQVLVAVEGRERSGTTAAVKDALAQERPVGLLRSLVESEGWAHNLVQSGQAFVVNTLDDVMRRVEL